MVGIKLFILLYLLYMVNAQYRRTPPRQSPERSEPDSDEPRTKSVPSDREPETNTVNRRLGRSEKFDGSSEAKLDSNIKLEVSEVETKKESNSTEDVSQLDLIPRFQPDSKLTGLDSHSDQSTSKPDQSEPEPKLKQEGNIENGQEPKSEEKLITGTELEPKIKPKLVSVSKVKPKAEAEPKPERKVEIVSKSKKPNSPETKPYTPVFRPRSTFPKLVSGLTATDFKCGENNAFYAVVDSCDTFVECENTVPNVRVCPDGLLFNRKAKWPSFPCSYPSEVECGNNTHIDTSTIMPSGECPRRFGNFASNNNDCEKYIVCEDGRATLMNCPMGLGFNSKLGACDWPANIPDCNPIVFKDFNCPVPAKNDKSDKIYNYRYKNSCKLYITCFRGESRLLRCDSGLSFDDRSARCISSAAVSKCKSTSEIVDTKLLLSG